MLEFPGTSHDAYAGHHVGPPGEHMYCCNLSRVQGFCPWFAFSFKILFSAMNWPQIMADYELARPTYLTGTHFGCVCWHGTCPPAEEDYKRYFVSERVSGRWHGPYRRGSFTRGGEWFKIYDGYRLPFIGLNEILQRRMPWHTDIVMLLNGAEIPYDMRMEDVPDLSRIEWLRRDDLRSRYGPYQVHWWSTQWGRSCASLENRFHNQQVGW